MFCKVVQDIVDSRTVDQIALGEAGLVKQAEDYFKENSPWLSDTSDPDYSSSSWRIS